MSNIEVINPFSGDVVFSEESESLEEISSKISRLRAANIAWSSLSVHARAELIRNALSYFRERRDGIASAITSEVGKPVRAAAEELDFMIERALVMCTLAEQGATSPYAIAGRDDFQGRMEYVSKGVVYIISPWNYPLFCAINGTICALLTGSTVLLKHTTAPSVGRHFRNAFNQMGGIENLLLDAVIDYRASAQIIETCDINHVIFTGSVQGGRAIQTSLANRANNDISNPFLTYTLELGGNDAAYIAEDADLAHAVESTVNIGRLHNSGQSCCAVKRVFVHEKHYESYLAAAKDAMNAHRFGDPTDPSTTLGPLFSREPAVRMLKSLVDDAQKNGARIVCGGHVVSVGKTLFIEPTLLADVCADMNVMRTETFGPVLPVMRVSSDDEAIRMVCSSLYGLTSAIFTRCRSRAEQFITQMNTGTVFVNRCNFVDARLGWIGYGQSGNGAVSLSPFGLQSMSNLKSVNIDPTYLSQN
ncbi:aldehyde dehydrogenase family protein [Paraburkholderia sartisoli]|uniref:Acyl-CoA reductase n=1 Tax=Paraburkholderia sartisoli TaxID=83784 RepID=A0A1H4D2C0_9BURK|nr:aldehyde dehydrogenase family protein [Paraburkholderia sartisoli]SEA66472.1 Acyl-CoA reductase [Paraburkholderia sartisoli]